MDWKEYKEMPDDGLFENISRRLKVRKIIRTTAVTAFAAAVAVSAVAVVRLNNEPKQGRETAVIAQHDTGEARGLSSGDGSYTQELALGEDAAAVKMLEDKGQTTPSSIDASRDEEAVSFELAVINEHREADAMAEAVLIGTDAWAPVDAVAASGKNGQGNGGLPVSDDKADERSTEETSTANVATFALHDEEERATTAAEHTSAAKNDADGSGSQWGNSNPNNGQAIGIIKCPNAIVPSSDEAENRYFSVTPLEQISGFKLQIYNRRGVRVYTTTDVSFRWDGGGLPQDSYVWVATFRDGSGASRVERGTVLILR